MIKYLLNIKCENKDCENNNVESSFWYEKEQTSHPCGICGEFITFCEVLEQREFPEQPLPPMIEPEPAETAPDTL